MKNSKAKSEKEISKAYELLDRLEKFELHQKNDDHARKKGDERLKQEKWLDNSIQNKAM